MEGTGEVSGKKRKQPRCTGKRRRQSPRERPHAHPYELRRKAVQLCLEEGFPVAQVARELGFGLSTLGAWVRRFRAQGEAGLLLSRKGESMVRGWSPVQIDKLRKA